MGSTMKPSIFNEKVAMALRNWHRSARKHLRDSRRGGSVTPTSSQHTTPSHHQYLMHLRQSSVDSLRMSPRRSSFDVDQEAVELPPPTDVDEGEAVPSSSACDLHDIAEQEPELAGIVVVPVNESENTQCETGTEEVQEGDPETLPRTSSDRGNIHGVKDGECQEPASLANTVSTAKSTSMQHEIDIEPIESPSACRGMVAARRMRVLSGG